MKLIKLLFFSPILLVLTCQNKVLEGNGSSLSGYPISLVNIRNVKITDDFWLPIIQRVQEKTIQYALEKCDAEGRFDHSIIRNKLGD